MKNNSLETILIVDDDQSVRNSLMRYLQDAGYEVSTVANAEEALALAKDKIFDVAIVDMRLPGMNGDELILKLHKNYKSLRFLIYTGSSNYVLADALISIGLKPEHVITKPVMEMSLFLEKIARILNKGQNDE